LELRAKMKEFIEECDQARKSAEIMSRRIAEQNELIDKLRPAETDFSTISTAWPSNDIRGDGTKRKRRYTL